MWNLYYGIFFFLSFVPGAIEVGDVYFSRQRRFSSTKANNSKKVKNVIYISLRMEIMRQHGQTGKFFETMDDEKLSSQKKENRRNDDGKDDAALKWDCI